MSEAEVIPIIPAATGRRLALGGSLAALAAAFVATPATAVTTPGGRFLDITRQFREAVAEFDRLDDITVHADFAPSEMMALDAKTVAADARRYALHDAVFTVRPETMADAAVIAAHALSRVCTARQSDLGYALRSGSLEALLADMQRAFAGILSVVAPVAGVDVADIGWPDMAGVCARTLAEMEG